MVVKRTALRNTLQRVLSEMIDGPQRLTRRFTLWRSTFKRTYDTGTTDYGFWDRVRKGKAKGLEVSGLLIKPLNSKVAGWTLGQPPKFKTQNKRAAEALNQWWGANHARLLAAYEDALALGDSYVAINPDLTPTLLPPNVVTPLVHPNDYSQVTGWQTEETYPLPSNPAVKQTIRYQYLPTGRVKTISRDPMPRSQPQWFPNLIGRMTLIHIPNLMSADERFGRPECEALIPMLHRYGQIIEAAVDGNIRQGRPTPTIEGMSDQQITKFWDQYRHTSVIKHSDGTEERVQEIEFDADQMITLPTGATFNWKSPNSFTSDTQTLLQILFYLYVQHSEMPEWALGNALSGNRASAETQVEPLVKFIEKKQGMAKDWIIDVVRVVNAMQAVFDPGLRLAEADDIEVLYEPLTNDDGELTLKALELALGEHLIDRETAQKLLPLRIENHAEVLKKAEQERDEAQAQFDSRTDWSIRDAEQRTALNSAKVTPIARPA